MEVGGSNNDDNDNDNTLKRLRLLWVGWGFFRRTPLPNERPLRHSL